MKVIGFIRNIRYMLEDEVERRLDLCKNDTFALISKSISDEECVAMKHKYFIFSVEKTLKDKKGKPFYICTPVREIKEAEASYLLLSTLTVLPPFDPETHQILRRLAYANGVPITTAPEDIQQAIIGKMATGELKASDAAEQCHARIESTPDTAHLVVNGTADIGRVAYISVMDENNRDCYVAINAKSLPVWKKALPSEYIRVRPAGNDIIVNINFDKVHCNPVNKDVLDGLEDGSWRRILFKATPKDGGQSFSFWVMENDEDFQKYLDLVGICQYQKHYVPAGFPAWQVRRRYPNQAFSVGIHDTIKVEFANGMTAEYPAVFMVKRYPGELKGMDVTVSGNTLENMQFNFTPNRFNG